MSSGLDAFGQAVLEWCLRNPGGSAADCARDVEYWVVELGGKDVPGVGRVRGVMRDGAWRAAYEREVERFFGARRAELQCRAAAASGELLEILMERVRAQRDVLDASEIAEILSKVGGGLVFGGKGGGGVQVNVQAQAVADGGGEGWRARLGAAREGYARVVDAGAVKLLEGGGDGGEGGGDS